MINASGKTTTMIKRLFDIVASATGLVGLSLLLVGELRFGSNWIRQGPCSIVAGAAGTGGKPFRIFKFRSMVADADKIGGSSTSGDDARVTRSGRFIRRFKL